MREVLCCLVRAKLAAASSSYLVGQFENSHLWVLLRLLIHVRRWNPSSTGAMLRSKPAPPLRPPALPAGLDAGPRAEDGTGRGESTAASNPASLTLSAAASGNNSAVCSCTVAGVSPTHSPPTERPSSPVCGAASLPSRQESRSELAQEVSGCLSSSQMQQSPPQHQQPPPPPRCCHPLDRNIPGCCFTKSNKT